jgi:hypothetical protein
MPPALWVQGRPDQVHDYRDPESPRAPQRAGALRRGLPPRPGGAIELIYIDNAARQSAASFDPIAAFFHKHMPVKKTETAMAK